MAFGKTASCIIVLASIASGAEFPVRHEHWHDHCNGILTVDRSGVSFAGPKKHAWIWKFGDIQQLTLSADRITVLTYEDNKLLPGSDRAYRFMGKVPAAELYALLKDRLDQRLVAAIGEETSLPAWTFPVKHLGRVKGTDGILTFGSDSVVYSTSAKEDSRTWLYRDIDNLSSSGPFQLTVTTFERGTLADRREFTFDLKERMPEATYNEIWLQIQKKTGKIQ